MVAWAHVWSDWIDRYNHDSKENGIYQISIVNWEIFCETGVNTTTFWHPTDMIHQNLYRHLLKIDCHISEYVLQRTIPKSNFVDDSFTSSNNNEYRRLIKDTIARSACLLRTRHWSYQTPVIETINSGSSHAPHDSRGSGRPIGFISLSTMALK